MAAMGTKLRTLEGGRVAFWCPGCDGAHQVSGEGFTCAQTSVQIGHSFPVGTYECTRSGARITFSRTTAG